MSLVGRHELVDEPRGRVKAHPVATAAQLLPNAHGQVCFAGSAVADENGVASIVDEIPSSQVQCLLPIQRRHGIEMKVLQSLGQWELRLVQQPTSLVFPPLRDLSL